VSKRITGYCCHLKGKKYCRNKEMFKKQKKEKKEILQIVGLETKSFL